MTVIYPAVYTRTGDAQDTYLVSIPDLDGATEGHTLADAILMAKDYIGNALCLKAEGEMPRARDLKEIDPAASPFASAGETFASLVDVDLDAFRRKVQRNSRNRKRAEVSG